MSAIAYRIFLSTLVAIVFIVIILLIYRGISYYNVSLVERVYHTDHAVLKPSGTLGHGMGIIGSLFMIIGMLSYMIRKRYRFLSRLGLLKHWLEFHIFLCTLGPILILFHTSFKFGGLVAISFWSMVAVFMSGIIGRFIYLQIPHAIDGHELNLNEVRGLKTDVAQVIRNSYNLDEETYSILADSVHRKVEIYTRNTFVSYTRNYFDNLKTIRKVKLALMNNNLPRKEQRMILNLIKDDIKLNEKIKRLDTMQNLFKYWHVAHLPFALVMLIIMLIHVAVTLIFGYRWIF
jgi:hypothetical protein